MSNEFSVQLKDSQIVGIYNQKNFQGVDGKFARSGTGKCDLSDSDQLLVEYEQMSSISDHLLVQYGQITFSRYKTRNFPIGVPKFFLSLQT